MNILECDFGKLSLSADREWESDNPDLKSYADSLAPFSSYSPSDGDPESFLLNKIRDKIGGEITICHSGPEPDNDAQVTY